MAKTKITLVSSGMRELLNSAGVRADVRAAAEVIASRARQSAPVVSGRYRDSISVISDTTDRAVERVNASAPHAFLVESKTGNLKRAVRG